MNHAHRYRLLACDIDNTLLRFPDPPSPRVAGAIRAAIEAGITVVLVTGRAFRRARPIALSLDLTTPIVCNHGGSIRDLVTQRTLQRQTLPRALVSEIVTEYRARRDALIDGLGMSGGPVWKIEKPLATMFVWAPLPESHKALGSLEFSKLLLEQANVAVSPGVGFGPYGEGFVRFALVENTHRVRQAVRNIRRLLRSA